MRACRAAAEERDTKEVLQKQFNFLEALKVKVTEAKEVKKEATQQETSERSRKLPEGEAHLSAAGRIRTEQRGGLHMFTAEPFVMLVLSRSKVRGHTQHSLRAHLDSGLTAMI